MIPCSIKYHSHVWCKFKVWRSSGQHWPDSSNLNKCVDQNCLFCKNWIVFVIKLWLESCSFPNYPSATIFTPALNPANAILNTTKSWSSGVSQPKCTFLVHILPPKIIFTCVLMSGCIYYLHYFELWWSYVLIFFLH